MRKKRLTKKQEEYIYNLQNSFSCVKCGQVYTEESGAYIGFTCDDCLDSLSGPPYDEL